jgi:RHS repeat-associated protein
VVASPVVSPTVRETTPRLVVSATEEDPGGGYIRGFLAGGFAPGEVPELFVDGRHEGGAVDPADGSFEVFVERTLEETLEGAPRGWSTELEFYFPEGRHLSHRVVFGDPTEASDGANGADGDASDLQRRRVKVGEATTLSHGGARLELPADALDREAVLSIRKLLRETLPALDAGMTNVTAEGGGFRMGPAGQRFVKPIRLTLPYDPAAIPAGMTPEDVHTFYFDASAGRWRIIERVAVEGATVVSRTDHFTVFVNATLALPESPEGEAYGANSIADLEAADPSAEITLLAVPSADPTGSAGLSFPLDLPPGRRGLQPDLAVTYSSGGGSGWLGEGWDLQLPTITVDTTFGVPRYRADRETESYLLNGAYLAPAADRINPGPRQGERAFTHRVEGSFERIVRHGDHPANYWWEVTDQSGTRYLYGQTAQARLAGSTGIFDWHLEQIVDLHGNTVDFTYWTDRGNNGEPWVALYPRSITYTGGGGSPGGGYYRVDFLLDAGDRPDRLSTCMPGFKVATRYRLAEVQVRAGEALVRGYRFQYRIGDFAKSLLEAVAVTGEDGSEFYRHTFDYFTMPRQEDGFAGFGDQVAWGSLGSASDATKTFELSGGGHAFVGGGPPTCEPHAGVQVGVNVGFAETEVAFLDLNGDGLPDRIGKGGGVELNRYDPASDQGGFTATNFPGTTFLGHNDDRSFDFGGGLHAVFDQAVLGVDWVWSHSEEDRTLLDVNGDGRPDLASTQAGFRAHLNSGTGFDAAQAWGGFTLGGLDLSLPEQEAEVLATFRRTDPIRQLVLPFAGTVTVEGAVTRAMAGGEDGVEVALYHNSSRVWQRAIAPADTAPCLPAPGNGCGGGLSLVVQSGDRLYFLARAVSETSGDTVFWSPRVRYTGLSAEAAARREVYGPPVFTFDAAEDFRLSGTGAAAWVAPAAGEVRVLGTLTKESTADDVVVSVRRNDASPLYQRALAAGESGTFDEVPAIAVEQGDALYFEVASRTTVDPERVRWTPTVTYEGGTYCRPDPLDPQGGDPFCGAVSCAPDPNQPERELCTLSGDPLPGAPLPAEGITQAAAVHHAVHRLLPQAVPTATWQAPAAATYQVAVAWSAPPADPFGPPRQPVTLYVQGSHQLHTRREVAANAGDDTFTVPVALAAGEALTVTVVAEKAQDVGSLSASARPSTAAAEDPSLPLPVNHRYRGNAPSVLSGGYHGWFYGEWNGEKPFSEGGLHPESEDFVPAFPRWDGVEGVPGPLWQASGFDLHIAADAFKPSRLGGNMAAEIRPGGASSGGGPSLLRRTSGRTAGVDASFGLGLSLSRGFARTQLDFLDLNGDQYPDQVSGGAVRFSNGVDGFGPLEAIEGLGDTVRRVEDANVAASVGGIGLGTFHTKRSGEGKARSVTATMPTVAAAAALSQARTDLLDVNGDGLPDRVSMDPGSPVLKVRLNLGYRFGGEELWPLPGWGAGAGDRCREATNFAQSEVASQVTDLDTPNALALTSSASLNVGAAVGIFGGGVATTVTRQIVHFQDINGDGLADHLYKDHGEPFFRVKLNRGDHWGSEERWYAPDWSTQPGAGYDPNLFQCFDALSFEGNLSGNGSAGADICIPLVPPIPVVGLKLEFSAQAAGGNGGMQLFFQDLDGDGLIDHGLKTQGDGTVYVRRNQARKVNLLRSVFRPLGGAFHLDYARQGNRVDLSDPEHRIDMPDNQWVLASVLLEDGLGHSYPTHFDYGNDAFYDRAERVFYGYARIVETRADGSTVERSFHNQDFYRRLLPSQVVTREADGKLFTVETTDWQLRQVAPDAFFPQRGAETVFFYEGTTSDIAAFQKSTTTTFEYGPFGNPIRVTEEGDEGRGDDVITTIDHRVDAATYQILPQHIEVRDGDGAFLRGQDLTYDPQGNPTEVRRALVGGKDPDSGASYGSSDAAVWRYTWDGEGNLSRAVDPLGFAIEYQYDPQTRSQVTTITDSFGYTTAFKPNLKYARPDEVTDNNGQPMAYRRDRFGRVVEVFAPREFGGSIPTLAMEYHPEATVPYAVTRHRDLSRGDTLDTVLFVDGLGRTLQDKREAEIDAGSGTSTQTGVVVSGRQVFDSLGRLTTMGQPVFDTGPLTELADIPLTNPTHFDFDRLDRVRRVRFPFGAETRVDYDFGDFDGVRRLRLSRTDPEGHTTHQYFDVRGNILGIEQRNTVGGTQRTLRTRYDYNALSELARVTDPEGHTTTVELDSLGRRTAIDNPDLGRTEYRWDRGGNLGARIPANLAARGEQIRLRRTFGRLDRIDYPDSPAVVYTYGAPGAPFNRADRVATVTNESGVEEFFYGPQGEVEAVTETAVALNGSGMQGPFTTRFTHDSFGRVLSMTYPDGEVLTYTFNAGGQVKGARGVLGGVTYDYLSHRGYDAFGDVVRTVFGNGVETRRGYDAASRRLATTTSTAPNLGSFQEMRLTHSPAGAVTTLENALPASHPSELGGGFSQTFHYDALYQLVGAEGGYHFAPNKESHYTLAMDYSANGRILRKSQFHEVVNSNGKGVEQGKTSYTWDYAYNSPQPYAPSHIGERSYQHDANGNQLGWEHDSNGTRFQMRWDEENRLKSVDDNGQTTRFLYDADGTRTNKEGPHGETLYINAHYTVRNGSQATKHVWVDSERLASKLGQPAVDSDGGSGGTIEHKRYFFHPDPMGSTHFVTDDDGELYQHLLYFPFGELWVDERAESERTPYLYSGKELDDETGLAYFGHRYYAPRQGQWVSADPILENLLEPETLAGPDLSANAFRTSGSIYAHVGNDPINMMDPNGLGKVYKTRSGRNVRSPQAIYTPDNFNTGKQEDPRYTRPAWRSSTRKALIDRNNRTFKNRKGYLHSEAPGSTESYRADKTFKSKNSKRPITVWQIDHSKVPFRDLQRAAKKANLTREQFIALNNDTYNLRLLTYRENTSGFYEPRNKAQIRFSLKKLFFRRGLLYPGP